MKRIWSMQQSSGRMSEILCGSLGISPVVTDILAQRGFREPEEAIEFLRPTLLNLLSPFCFKDMNKTVQRLSLAFVQKEKILIYGDYDVDGVTSTTILYKVLSDLGFQAVAYIPHRQDEGYGLHSEAIERAAKAGVGLLITVDCGITAVSEVRLAHTLKIDVIITDHHEPPDTLPEAFAILNPKVENSGYPFRDLAGVGVAFKLAQALLHSFGNQEVGIHTETQLLDLVALGTIADLVPLVGENRIFVQFGLRQMADTHHLGLLALLEECGLRNGSPLKAGQIGFMVAPRINAAGRMDSARAGLELLLTGDQERASELAHQLTLENQARQDVEKAILAEAIAMLECEPIPRVIVLSADHWHHGVIGIVASRLVERYYRPVFMIAEEGDEAKGSARGIAGYPVLEQLSTQAQLLIKFGGHRQAAGFSLLTADIGHFRAGLNEQALVFEETLFQEVLKIDRQVSIEAVSADLLRQLEQMAPFGYGNPGPTLASQAIPVHSVSAVGKERSHIKFRFGAQGEQEGIAFRLGDRMNELKDKISLDAAFSLDWNTFRGRENVQLMIKDIQSEAQWSSVQEIAATNDEPTVEWLDWRNLSQEDWPLRDEEPLWIWDTDLSELALRRGKNELVSQLDQEETGIQGAGFGVILGLPLTEEDFREAVEKLQDLGVFRIALAGFQSPDEEKVRQRCRFIAREELINLYRELLAKSKTGNPFHWEFDAKVSQNGKLALKIFEELGLLRILGGTDKLAIEWIPAQSKLDLETSLRFRFAKERLEKALKFQLELLNSVGIVYN
ncbi:single-stranded-DNA-specific exonuclease RecJ [Desulfosporosinus burensis]